MDELIPKKLLTRWQRPVRHTAVEDHLTWRHPSRGVPLSILETVGPENGWLGLGKFSSALLQAGFFDNRSIPLAGSLIALPSGKRLIERFQDIVDDAYQRAGLKEFEYPILAPLSSFERMQRVFDLKGRLLYVGDLADFDSREPRAALVPTGEAVVYAHWRQIVRSKLDLPIQMYQRAKYFRPARSKKHSGRSVFRSNEAGDVYEFHCCHASALDNDAAFWRFLNVERAIAECVHVPTIWATRPPWTNNSTVSEHTIGGDAPLPSGSTLQVGCIYNQGQILSRTFDIGFSGKNGRSYTFHVAGAVSRRFVLAHLLLGMNSSGDFLVHPDLAPHQVVITFVPGTECDDNQVAALDRELRHRGYRAALVRVVDRKQLNRSRTALRQQGVPVEVFVQGRRSTSDMMKVVVTRADTRGEAVVYLHELGKSISLIETAMALVGECYQRRVDAFVSRQCVDCTESNLRDIISSGRVAVCPLLPTEEHVRKIAMWKSGEVLGFAESGETGCCVLTRTPTNIVAFVSRRV